MSENTVSHPILIVNENAIITSSHEVAKRFEKRHDNVLREIKEKIANLPESFTALNFEASEYTDSTGRKLPCYNLTRNGFSVLAMGFTGKTADLWKVKYVEAFDKLEKTVYEQSVALACQKAVAEAQSKPAMQALRQEGKLEGIKEASNPRTDRLAKIRRAMRYLERDLTLAEAAKLVNMHPETLRENLILLGLRKGKKRYHHRKKKAVTIVMPKGDSHE